MCLLGPPTDEAMLADCGFPVTPATPDAQPLRQFSARPSQAGLFSGELIEDCPVIRVLADCGLPVTLDAQPLR